VLWPWLAAVVAAWRRVLWIHVVVESSVEGEGRVANELIRLGEPY
jgi:hypothetical protein